MSEVSQRISMKAILVCDGKVLILRKAKYEGNGGKEGKWNTPGGRVEPGEAWEAALRREISEESGISDLEIGMPLYVGEWTPTISGVPTQIICLFVVCNTNDQTVTLNYEHDSYEWIQPKDRAEYDILPPESEVIGRYAELAAKGMFKD